MTGRNFVTRVLDPDEWASKLAGTELEALAASLPENHARVVVVEDGDAVVGCWAVLTCPHAEGLWIADDHRGKAAVLRRLLAGVADVAQSVGATGVLVGTDDEAVTRLVEKRGGVAMPTMHALPMVAK